ncbi:MAG: iron chelate uptake ABC transporter family permease subunit [Heliobacteriaceae bacterium]|nr:iron chelate uptake ABC transporter family permease subunit [Heliobacteriaceae bacterium]MDD4588127.1 iron chelate uptake ABC transporter family permease subunit [Heliobacteriaceae bacterium]
MDPRRRYKYWRLWISLLLAGLAGTVVVCTVIGPAAISPGEVLAILGRKLPGAGRFIARGDWPDSFETIVFQLRLARVVLAVLVGAGLAVAGVVLQGLLQNPLADPYILGISSGAALGATLAMLFGLGTHVLGIYAVPLVAFVGAVVTVVVVYTLARKGNRVPMATLLLAGIAIGSFLSALTSLAMITSGQNLQQVIFWLMGGLAGRGWDHVIVLLPYVFGGFILMYFSAHRLNVILLGEEAAQHLGIDVERLKLVMLGAATLVAAAAVAVSGVIGFVGLIIPHTVRMLVGPDHRVLLPAAALVGGIFLALADALARVVAAPEEIPVGVITAICGGPFFIYLLRRKKDAGI